MENKGDLYFATFKPILILAKDVKHAKRIIKKIIKADKLEITLNHSQHALKLINVDEESDNVRRKTKNQ